jgi:hypothetical protein
MNDDYWARTGVGASIGFADADGKALPFNPVRVPRELLPPPFRPMMLEPFMKSGGEVLACNLALQFVAVPHYAAVGLSGDAAYAAAKADLLPGVILQPSGVFALGVAQQNGCAVIPISASE